MVYLALVVLVRAGEQERLQAAPSSATCQRLGQDRPFDPSLAPGLRGIMEQVKPHIWSMGLSR